jgi:hypothetical protein
MFHEVADEPGELTGDELYERLAAEVEVAVEDCGVDAVADETDVDRATLEALADGERPELTLEEAAAIVATRDDVPPADVVAAESRDALLMGMTNAVMDVEALASSLNGELEPREIQSKVEGRFPMTLREFARMRAHLASQSEG